MYDYGIYPRPDEKLFYAQCETKKPLLEDVDGTLIQIYVYPRGHVIIKNDEMLGDVHVESEFDLKPFDALLRVKK